MYETLKPCPFCGTHIVDHEHDGIYNWVECQNVDCQATGKVTLILGRVEAAEYIGKKQWNTRPIEDDLRETIAAQRIVIDQLRAQLAARAHVIEGDELP